MKYSFETALAFMKQGKKVRRTSWDDDYVCAYIRDGNIWIKVYSEEPQEWGAGYFFVDDILADDWEIIE